MSHDTVVHRIIRPAVRRLACTWVTPDHLTALRFATALAAAAAFACGGGWVTVGAGVFTLSALLDRADGELARQTRRFSQHGHRYDLVADCAAGVMAFIGLGVGATGGPLGAAALAFGLAAAAGVTALFWQVNVQRAGRLPRYTAGNGRVLADPDDAMLAVPLLLWCAGPELVLLVAGTITPLLALWMAWARRPRALSPPVPEPARVRRALEPAAIRTLLLTPGPLTTSDATRAALGRDWGSRDADFVAMSERVRRRLTALAHGDATHATVLVQGAGTFAIEAAIGTLVPRDGKLLVLVNGAYGRRAAEMAALLGRATAVLECPEDQAVDPGAVARALSADPAITDVLLVHLETTSGLLNPLLPIAAAVAAAGRRLLLDAMSSFGAVPIDLRAVPCAAVAASANKCLEGVPGLAFVIAEAAHLKAMDGNSASTSLDLYAQWRGFETTGQWRFTPPTQVVAALDAALDQLDAEGGVAARGQRYRQHCAMLMAGLARLGFQTYLPAALQGPVIVTVRDPGPPFSFASMYHALHAQGIVLYPGKLTAEPSFRIGCIGAIDAADIERTLAAIAGFIAGYSGQAAAD